MSIYIYIFKILLNVFLLIWLVRNWILLPIHRCLPLSHTTWSNPVIIWALEVKSTSIFWNLYAKTGWKEITSIKRWSRITYTSLSDNCSRWKIRIEQELVSVCMKIFQIVEVATEQSVGAELTPTSVFPRSAGREGSSGSQLILLPPVRLCLCNILWLLAWVLCIWLHMNH